MIEDLLRKHSRVSDQVSDEELQIILHKVKYILENGPSGVIVEMGCYAGTTSLFISRLIEKLSPETPFHVYDSFSGLPEKLPEDHSPSGHEFRAGELSVSKKQFILNYKKANLKTPYIHKGWFEDLSGHDIPANISFAFLDGDYYSSIKACLRLIENSLLPGAFVLVDDYDNSALPGAAKAVNEWLRTKNARLSVQASLAVISLPQAS